MRYLLKNPFREGLKKPADLVTVAKFPLTPPYQVKCDKFTKY